MQLGDVWIYVPLATASLVLAILIAFRPDPRLPRGRLPITLATFLGAFLVFVGIDLASGRAITRLADVPGVGLYAFVAVVVMVLANLTVLILLRGRTPR